MFTTEGARLISESRLLQEDSERLICESRRQQTLVRLLTSKSQGYRKRLRAGTTVRPAFQPGFDSLWYLHQAAASSSNSRQEIL